MPILLQSYTLNPADTGMGEVMRPGIASMSGERIATLETLFGFFVDAVMDPDKALAKDAAFIEKLMRHPRVSACMNIREQKVAILKSRVDAAEEAEDEQLAEAARLYAARRWAAIKEKDQLFQEMEQAVLHGGVAHEWIWEKRLIAGQPVQVPARHFPVHKTRFQFDRQGNLAIKTRTNPVWGAAVGSNPSNPQTPQTILPMGKFVYHRYERSPGSWNAPDDEGYNYYGRGEDEDLYDVVVRDLSTWLLQQYWLKRYGNPPQMLYSPETTQWNGWAESIIADLLTKQIARVPGNTDAQGKRLFELSMPEVPSPSFDAFQNARKQHYNDIEAILLGSEGVLSTAEKGGYSGHKSRNEEGPDMLMRRDAARIGSTLSAQLVPAMLRYGPQEMQDLPTEMMPSIVLYDEQDIDVGDLETATKIVPVPRKFLYQAMRIPVPTVDRKTGQMEEAVFNGGQSDPFEALENGAEPKDDDEPRRPIGDGETIDEQPKDNE